MKATNCINHPSSRVKRDEDFWNDVFAPPYQQKLFEEASPFEVKASNAKRLVKFETFLIKHGQKPRNLEEQQSKIRVAKINQMLSIAKVKTENRKRSQEQAYKHREETAFNACTFAPQINKEQNSKDAPLNSKPSNISVYKRNVAWSNNLKGKKARQKQTKELTNVECSFRPSINYAHLDSVFNSKANLDYHPYQNIYYLKTQATNKKKRKISFDYSMPQLTDKRVRSLNSCSIKNMNESISALRNELRNFNEDSDG